MKFPKWVKNTGFVLGTILTAGVGTVSYMARQAENDMAATMAEYDGVKVNGFLQTGSQNKEAAARIQKDMDIHSSLLFYCGPKISKKIAGIQSQDGHEMVQEHADHFVVWDADEGSKRLEKILCEIDPDTKAQACITYDIKNKDLTFHFGGTDFSNFYDLAAATTSLTGSMNPRSHKGADYVMQAVKILHEEHPEVNPEELNVAIVGHSSGATLAPAAVVALAEQGFKTNSVTLLDPCGADAAYNAVEHYIGISKEVLVKNTETIKPCVNGPLDYFKQATSSVGEKKTCQATGHMGKHFIIAFNKARAVFN